ncbi:MAG: hypothetical protein B7X41_15810, partial [Microbacterium sp. 14-71-5]
DDAALQRTAQALAHQNVVDAQAPREYFDAVEQICLAHGGRPHWGKLHSLDADQLRERYPRFDDFLALRDRLDPERRFGNRYLERVLGA